MNNILFNKTMIVKGMGNADLVLFYPFRDFAKREVPVNRLGLKEILLSLQVKAPACDQGKCMIRCLS